MAEEKQSLLHRLQQWLFGGREAERADQKERRDEISAFMEERAEEEAARETANKKTPA
jgi:hypothetical protein